MLISSWSVTSTMISSCFKKVQIFHTNNMQIILLEENETYDNFHINEQEWESKTEDYNLKEKQNKQR